MDTNRAGHEVRDVDVPRITMLAGGLVSMLVVAMLLMVWAFNYLAAREKREQRPLSPMAAQRSGQLPPEPRLQVTPRRDLQDMRAEEDALLETYGWVDRSAGVVRIPVEEAIQRLAQRGLPARRGEVR
jgi:hypothetical protein